MADSEEPPGDQVAKQDAAADDEGVQPGEWSVVVQMGSGSAFGAVFANGPPSRFVQSGGVAWRGRSGSLELAASGGEGHSFQMQGLRFHVTNDRHHLDLHYVGLFLDRKLTLGYI
jgi:hypothetical protein